MLRRPYGKWLTMMLLIAAMAGVVAHVCVVPLHAHAVPIEQHGSHDDDTADHSVHTASCEAARGGGSVNALLPPAQFLELLPVAPPPRLLGGRSPAADVLTGESPPLFLLHASLLI
jgi:hypothetical protein